MHLIDVLIGRLTDKVTQFGHDQLSVFGVGRELNEKQWRAVLRQLVAMGHLRADSEAFGALKLTESRARRAEGRNRSEAARAGGRPRSRDPEQVTAQPARAPAERRGKPDPALHGR